MVKDGIKVAVFDYTGRTKLLHVSSQREASLIDLWDGKLLLMCLAPLFKFKRFSLVCTISFLQSLFIKLLQKRLCSMEKKLMS